MEGDTGREPTASVIGRTVFWSNHRLMAFGSVSNQFWFLQGLQLCNIKNLIGYFYKRDVGVARTIDYHS